MMRVPLNVGFPWHTAGSATMYLPSSTARLFEVTFIERGYRIRPGAIRRDKDSIDIRSAARFERGIGSFCWTIGELVRQVVGLKNNCDRGRDMLDLRREGLAAF